jgi:sporulation protein YlmC with PRC-barrel domain
MRASELLGRNVRAADGRSIGIVADIRCVLDGPLRGALCAPRVTALVVSRRHTGSMLGYDRRDQQGPWLVRVLVRRLHRHQQIIPWEQLDTSAETIVVRPAPR